MVDFRFRDKYVHVMTKKAYHKCTICRAPIVQVLRFNCTLASGFIYEMLPQIVLSLEGSSSLPIFILSMVN